ncbi:general secretion pathway protein GspD [Vibrio diazotrophicus]|uniref:General secretion pathway protein GspD n=1 Tax=Vibrio diazotrophicus TaxID=685 RepID=A0A2J8I4T7_VIBDI|nr:MULTISPECIES: pilus assembly protein N-terminal domain-containing protein [Vibrio]MCF7361911.1 pilus assembly protein N-terminal domain-containing protein [Vibrio sp. A1-b2]PNI05545.1 general secretion pathway protein GspD [Vibrio diazotrophicus]
MKDILFAFYIAILSFSVSANEFINLDQGSAKTVFVDRQISTIFIADKLVADYEIIDHKRVVVFGVGVGNTTLIAYDQTGKEIKNIELVVNYSLRLLKEAIRSQFPEESIEIINIGDRVVLNGTVNSERVKKQIYILVGEMLSKERAVTPASIMTGSTSPDGSGSDEATEFTGFDSVVYAEIVNNIVVLKTEQVNVKVTVAEVSSTFLSELGISYHSNTGASPGLFISKLFDFSARDIVAAISAINNDQIGQILAEPNLTVVSGEPASFLVGGEVPIALWDGDKYQIEYKEYGIKLSMVAKVVDQENVRLSLLPEVSALDEMNETTNGLQSVPAFVVRRAQTTVQLKNGQSFVLAGLLSSEQQEVVEKIPGLGDIPLIGSLFRYASSNRKKTELIIIATVNFVDPVAPESLLLPKFERTSNLELFLNLDLSRSEELKKIADEGGFQ